MNFLDVIRGRAAAPAYEASPGMNHPPGIGPHVFRAREVDSPVIYGPDETFPIGGSKVLRQSGDDVATVIGVGRPA